MINYVTGDATQPKGIDIIVHVCNNAGGWGAGFVLALSKRWPEPEQAYRRWAADRVEQTSGAPFELGKVQYVNVEPRLYVANMIAQDGWRHVDGVPPIRYDAVEQCLTTVAKDAKSVSGAVHMPRIGCGLAGGEWDRIEEIINGTLVRYGVPVTVYDLP